MNIYLLLAATGLFVLPGAQSLGTRPPRPTQVHPAAKPKPRPRVAAKAPVYGAKADSLDGIPGHHFGEPRSSFPELEARGFNNLDGYVTYSLRENQPDAPGWFGKHADQVHATYWFRNDQFAEFSAVISGVDGQRTLLADEVVYLFGKGQRISDSFGQATTRWTGRKVLVEYVDGHGEGRLVVNSQAVLAQVVAEKQAKQKADAAARAASLKADNAVPRTH